MSVREALCRNCVNDFGYSARGGVTRPLCQQCETTYKWCPSCGYALVHAAFGPDPRLRDGLEGCCKQCKGRQFKARRHRYDYDPWRNRSQKLAARYGITRADWDRMVIEQGGCCAICETPTADLHVDHCHATGAVRGLLCAPCNKGLGHFGDDVQRMVAAVAYLMTQEG